MYSPPFAGSLTKFKHVGKTFSLSCPDHVSSHATRSTADDILEKYNIYHVWMQLWWITNEEQVIVQLLLHCWFCSNKSFEGMRMGCWLTWIHLLFSCRILQHVLLLPDITGFCDMWVDSGLKQPLWVWRVSYLQQVNVKQKFYLINWGTLVNYILTLSYWNVQLGP